MKLIIPNNIFATLFILAMDEAERPGIEVKEASLISSELNNNENCIGIIPSFDLITNQDFFVSRKFGIGFESTLSNSYLYFSGENDEISKILLKGDITTNEVILSKIVFKERYNLSPEISIDMNEGFEENNTYLIVGSDNWLDEQCMKGTSFCEQASELIELPYLNFVFASKNEQALKEFNSRFSNMGTKIVSGLSIHLDKIGMSTDINEFIKREIESVYFDLTVREEEGLRELLQIAYFHQIFDNIFDIKFVE
jgi:hypothetical protein